MISAKHGYTGNGAAFVEIFQAAEKSDYRVLWTGNKHNVPRERIPCASDFILSEAMTLCRARFALYTHVPADISMYLPKSILRINMWHGNPIKYILDDTPRKLGILRQFKRRLRNQDPKQSDIFLSGGDRFNEIMQRCTGLSPDKILSSGLPRNLQLYLASEKYHRPLRNALFAPTFRDKSTQECRVEGLVKAWENVYQQQGVSLTIKLHPNDHTNLDWARNYVWVSVAVQKDDINQLLLDSDLLISDYSSVAFDYLILKRPVFLLMDDFADYLHARGGTYIDRAELLSIFNCYKQADDLVSAIIRKDFRIFDDGTQRYNRKFDLKSFMKAIEKHFDNHHQVF